MTLTFSSGGPIVAPIDASKLRFVPTDIDPCVMNAFAKLAPPDVLYASLAIDAPFRRLFSSACSDSSSIASLRAVGFELGRGPSNPQGHSDGVTGMTVLPDGHRAVSCSKDRTGMLWDLRSGKPLATFSRRWPFTVLCRAQRDVVADDSLGRMYAIENV